MNEPLFCIGQQVKVLKTHVNYGNVVGTLKGTKEGGYMVEITNEIPTQNGAVITKEKRTETIWAKEIEAVC